MQGVAIAGVGMVTSLGLTFETSCAAARAGLSRARELDYFTVWSPTTGEILPVIGHQVPELTEGFEGRARLIRLLGGAIQDLRRVESDAVWRSHGLGWYVALPDATRIWRGSERVGDPDVRQRMELALEQAAVDQPEVAEVERILRAASVVAHVPKEPRLHYVSRDGHCGIAVCLARAAQDLAAGRVEYAVVLGGDSLLEPATLDWLEMTSRLKTPAVAAGLAPGEAGVAFLLYAPRNKPADVDAWAYLGAYHQAEVSHGFYGGKPPEGGRVIAEALRCCGAAENESWLVLDQNGEDYRALEWGQTLMHAQLTSAKVTIPAIAFGDTAAASGGVGVAVVLHAFRRQAAPADRAIVLSASDDIRRTVLVIGHAT